MDPSAEPASKEEILSLDLEAAECSLLSPVDHGAVVRMLNALCEKISSDINVTMDNEGAARLLPDDGAGKTTINLPSNADIFDMRKTGDDLEDRFMLPYGNSDLREKYRIRDIGMLPSLIEAFYTLPPVYHKAATFASAWLFDKRDDIHSILSKLETTTQEEVERIRATFLVNTKQLEEEEETELTGLHAVTGVYTMLRLLVARTNEKRRKRERKERGEPIRRERYKDDAEKTVEILRRLTSLSERARTNLAVAMTNLRMIPYAHVSESIVRQGHRTMLAVEQVTEYDAWLQIKKGLDKRIAASFEKKMKKDWDEKIREYRLSESGEITEHHGEPSDAMQEFISLLAKNDREGAEAGAQNNAAQSSVVDSAIKAISKVAAPLLENMPQPPEGTANVFEDETSNALWKLSTEYLKENEPQERRLMKDAIGCERLKAEMKELSLRMDWIALGAKEKEIAARIFSEVSRLPYDHSHADDGPLGMKSYETGMPEYLKKNRQLNCFSGPWLVASLLLESGIPYENIYFCNVNESSGERMGSHASLLLRFSDGSAAFLDVGFHKSLQTFPLGVFDTKNDVRATDRLFVNAEQHAKRGKKIASQAVQITLDPEVAQSMSMYRDFHIIPLDQGLAGTALLHTGIACEEQGKIDEAVAAYEAGLVSYPNHPDLLCRLAIIALQRGDADRAMCFLSAALLAYPSHLHAIFYSGVAMLQAEEFAQALSFFDLVAKDKRRIWGDAGFKEKAKEYCDRLTRYAELGGAASSGPE